MQAKAFIERWYCFSRRNRRPAQSAKFAGKFRFRDPDFRVRRNQVLFRLVGELTENQTFQA
jgi:hypothetical protein